MSRPLAVVMATLTLLLPLRCWKRLVLVPMVLLIVGCASTKMTSQVNPEAAGRTFSRVLVHGNFLNLEYRQLAEEKLCTELASVVDCVCFKSSELFFPGEEHSTEQIAGRLTELLIDGVLALQSTGSGTSSSYIPQTSYTTWSGNASPTRSYGGYNVNKPWANYEAVLWSTADGKVAWYATAASGGNAFTDPGDLISSASTKAISKLVSDGVITRTEK